MAKADNAFTVTKGLVEGHTEGDADVFVGVVVVDFEVAFGLDIEVEESVGGDLVEHVVEEGDAGIGVAVALAVDVDGDGDVGFFSGAGDGGDAGGEFEVLHGDGLVGAALVVALDEILGCLV